MCTEIFNLLRFYNDTYELVISGTGAMAENTYNGLWPSEFCSSMKSVTIGNGITSIGDYAFYYCTSLKNVTIPRSVTSVEFRKFENCSSLQDIYYEGSKSDWKRIEISSKNECLTSANIHYNSTVSDGGRVECTASNGNFSYMADGATCEISPEKSGDTTFTATIYDADGNPVSTDEQTMTSKAGFFDKIIAFFKKLFGLTKTIPQAFKGIL